MTQTDTSRFRLLPPEEQRFRLLPPETASPEPMPEQDDRHPLGAAAEEAMADAEWDADLQGPLRDQLAGQMSRTPGVPEMRDPFPPIAEGKMGVRESFSRVRGTGWASRIPFIGPFFAAGQTGADLKRLKYLSEMTPERMEYLRDQLALGYSVEPFNDPRMGEDDPMGWRHEIRFFEDSLNTAHRYLEDQKRGKTISARILLGITQLPGFMVEFLATGGVASGAKAVARKVATRWAGKAAKSLGGRAAIKTAELAAGGLARTATGMAPRVLSGTFENMLPRGMEMSEKGQLLITEAGDKPATAFLRAFGDVWIEAASEETGPLLRAGAGKVAKGVARAAVKYSPKAARFFRRIGKAIRKAIPRGRLTELLAKGGYHGMLEEMGEERVGAILRAATGVSKRPDQNYLESLLNAVPDRDALLVEAGIFAVPGAVSVAAGVLSDRGQEAVEEPRFRLLPPEGSVDLAPAEAPMPDVQGPTEITEPAAAPDAVLQPPAEQPTPQPAPAQEVAPAGEAAIPEGEITGEKPAGNEPWEMTQGEYEQASQGETYGDWYETPDGHFGAMRGSGGMGSNRVKLWSATDEFVGWYNRDELKLVRKTPRETSATKAADEWLADVSSRVEKLKTDNEALLLNKGIADQFRRAVESGRMTQEQYDDALRKGTVLNDADYEKASGVEQQIEDARNTPLEVPVNTKHRDAVRQALSQGKPVPSAVLQEYKGETWADEALAKMDQAPASEAELEADRMEGEEGEFQADPTEATAYDRKAGGFVAVPGAKQGPSKPWLSLDKTTSPNKGIADFFGRTKRFGSPMNKLRQAGARVKAGLHKRFWFLSELPHGKEFAYARDAIRTMPEQQRAMMERAVEDVQGYLEGEGTRQVLDIAGLDLLRQKVFTEDIILEGERATEEASHALAENPNLTDAEFNRIASRRFPEGTTRESWAAQKERVDELMERVPSVRDAYQKRQDLWKKVSTDLADRGVISQEAAKNVHYVRHFVLDYMDTQRRGAARPKKLKEPYRGYAKERKGTRKDISTDLLELELKALSDIYRDNAVQDLAEGLAEHYDRRGDMPEGANVQAWTANEGLVEWHFKRPNLMFMAQTVSDAKIAQLAQEGAELIAGEVSIPVSAMHKALVIGGKRKMFLIPGEVAAQLDDLPVTHQAGKLASFTAPITRFWKRWILRVNPIRYNKRNAIGDAERVNAAGKTHAFVRVPAAAKMLATHRAPAEHSEAYAKGTEYGAFGSSLWHEMGDARSRTEFERYQDVRDLAGWKRAMNRAAWPAKLASRVGQKIQDATQFREDILRAAVYLDALDQVDAYLNDGTPIRHWVGMQEEIHALAKIDKYRAAAKIARETLGDYGAFTPWENDRLRNELMPFYSWLKINTTFWPKVLKESFKEEAGKAAGTVAIRIGRGAWGVAKWTARISAAYAALLAWNNSDEEKRKKEAALPWWIRTRPHILTEGGVIYEPSALSDFVEWFDLEQIAPDLQRWERGQISTKELIAAVAATEAKAPINRIFQTLNPFLKTPLTLTGTKTFPDVFDSYHYARSFSSKTAAEAFLDVLGTDTRKFVDVAKGRRTLREVLTYYFTGSAYRPMTLADLEKRIQEQLGKATLKRKSRTTGRGPGEAKAGRERDVDILINRGGTPPSRKPARGSRTQRTSR